MMQQQAGKVTYMLPRSSSPFWRSRASASRRDPSPTKPVHNSGLVVGASYSHADMLAFDNLHVF